MPSGRGQADKKRPRKSAAFQFIPEQMLRYSGTDAAARAAGIH
jgi:hypothetical protein